MQKVPILLALLGVGVIALLLAWFDAAAVWAAVVGIGWTGFALLLLLQAPLFLVLALAWRVVVPGLHFRLLLWGRMVRDAATSCLPFSPVAGYVAGARALTLHGVEWPTSAAGTVVDTTAELAAQLLFTLAGAAVLILLRPATTLLGPLGIGIAAAAFLLALLLWQRHRIGSGLRALGRRLLGTWFAGTGGLARLQTELARLADGRRMAVATGVHLLGWIGTGVWTFAALRLLGAPIDLLHVLAFEALLDALVAAAFIVPGAAGVQEAGYVGFGAAFGVPPELALGVSLLRRGKDLVWGVPILLVWQWVEVRRLASRPG